MLCEELNVIPRRRPETVCCRRFREFEVTNEPARGAARSSDLHWTTKPHPSFGSARNHHHVHVGNERKSGYACRDRLFLSGAPVDLGIVPVVETAEPRLPAGLLNHWRNL